MLDNRTMKTKAVGDPDGLRDLRGGPLRGAPVVSVAVVDNPGEGADRLLERGRDIVAVGEDDVDVVELETREGGLGAFDNVLLREQKSVRRTADGSLERKTSL